MRKAGGSTARRLLKKYCSEHGIKFSAGEGMPLSHYRIEPDTFLVINLREPVQRVCSLYNAEGRWPFPATSWTADNMTPERAIPFEDWFRQREPIQSGLAPPLWRVPQNYYVKSLSGTGQEEPGGETVDASDYRHALRQLQRFDLVLICEWLHLNDFRRYVAERLSAPGSKKIAVEHLNKTGQFQDVFDIRGHMTSHEWEMVAGGNRWDRELYRFACWQTARQAGIEPPVAEAL
jgi:hypothetical protein